MIMKKSVFISSLIATFTNVGFAAKQVEHVCVNNHSVFSIEVGAGGLYSRGSGSTNWIMDFQGSLETSSCDTWSGFIGVRGYYGSKKPYDYGTSEALKFDANKTEPNTAGASGTNPKGTNPNISVPAGSEPTIQVKFTYDNNKYVYRTAYKNDVIEVKQLENAVPNTGKTFSNKSDDLSIDVINSQGIKTWGNSMLIALCRNICIPKNSSRNTKSKRHEACDCNCMNVGFVGGFIWDNFEVKSFVADEDSYGLWRKTSAKDWVFGIRVSGEIKTGSVAIVPSFNIMAQLHPRSTITGSVPEMTITLKAVGTDPTFGGLLGDETPAVFDPITYDITIDSVTIDRAIRASVIGDIKIVIGLAETTYLGVVPFIDWNWRALNIGKITDIDASDYESDTSILEDTIKFGLNAAICYVQ